MSWLAGCASEFVPRVMAVTPAATEAFSRDHLKVAVPLGSGRGTGRGARRGGTAALMDFHAIELVLLTRIALRRTAAEQTGRTLNQGLPHRTRGDTGGRRGRRTPQGRIRRGSREGSSECADVEQLDLPDGLQAARGVDAHRDPRRNRT